MTTATAPTTTAKRKAPKKKTAAKAAEAQTASETKSEATETKKPAAKKSGPEVKINPEFRDLLPKKSKESREQLKTDLEAHGCISPILVWKDTSEIVDGHNRYELCNELGIPYKVRSVAFPSADHVKKWIIDNCHAEQFTRDGWTQAEARKLANEYMEIEKRITAASGKEGKGPKKKRGRSSKRASKKTEELTGHKFSPAQLEVYNKLVKNAPELAKRVDAEEISVGKANELYRESLGNPVKRKTTKKRTKKTTPPEAEWSDALAEAVACYRTLSASDQKLFDAIIAK